MYRRNVLTVILASVVFTGCSDSDTPTTTGTSTPVGGGDLVISTLLDGTWISDCRDGGDVSSTHEFVASNGNMQSNFTFFDDPNCTVIESAISEMSTYTVGDMVIVDGSVEGITSAHKIDNIGGSASAFEIVGITTTGTILYFGDFLTGDGDTDATRATQLDLNEKYTKTDTTGTSTPVGGGAVVDTSVSAKYEGTYVESCAEDEAGFEVITTTIVGTTQTVRILEFTDAACTVPASPAEVVIVESLLYPGGTVETPFGNADFVDLTSESVTLDGQSLTAEQMQEATQDGFFNTEFDLFLFDGSSLFRGENTDLLDGGSAANRPITLESESIFRQ